MLWNWSELESDESVTQWLSLNHSWLYGSNQYSLFQNLQGRRTNSSVFVSWRLFEWLRWVIDLECSQRSKRNKGCRLAQRGWGHNEVMYCGKCVVAVSEISTGDMENKRGVWSPNPLALPLSLYKDLLLATALCCDICLPPPRSRKCPGTTFLCCWRHIDPARQPGTDTQLPGCFPLKRCWMNVVEQQYANEHWVIL